MTSACRTLKMEVVAPMPTASVSTAMKVNPRAWASVRRARRRLVSMTPLKTRQGKEGYGLFLASEKKAPAGEAGASTSQGIVNRSSKEDEMRPAQFIFFRLF